MDSVSALLEHIHSMVHALNSLHAHPDKPGMVFNVSQFNAQLELNGMEQFVIKLQLLPVQLEHTTMVLNVSPVLLLALLVQFGLTMLVNLQEVAPMEHILAELNVWLSLNFAQPA